MALIEKLKFYGLVYAELSANFLTFNFQLYRALRVPLADGLMASSERVVWALKFTKLARERSVNFLRA